MAENNEVAGGGAQLFDELTKKENPSHLADHPDHQKTQ